MNNSGNILSIGAIVLGVFIIGFVAVSMIGAPAQAASSPAEPITVELEQAPAAAGSCGADKSACDGSCGGSCGGGCGASSCGCGR